MSGSIRPGSSGWSPPRSEGRDASGTEKGEGLLLLQRDHLRVCTRTGPARHCPGLKDWLPQGSFSFLQHFRPFWWGSP